MYLTTRYFFFGAAVYWSCSAGKNNIWCQKKKSFGKEKTVSLLYQDENIRGIENHVFGSRGVGDATQNQS